MKLYLDETGTIVIDGELTALLTDSKLTEETSIIEIMDNQLPNNINIKFTGFNIVCGDNKAKEEYFNRFLANGTLFK